MFYPCCPESIKTAIANMLSRLSDKFSKLVCGFSPPSATMAPDDVDGEPRTPLLLPPGRTELRRSSSHPCIIASSSATGEPDEETRTEEVDEEAVALGRMAFGTEDEGTVLPCVAFPSQYGYKVFSFAENRMSDDDDVRLCLVAGRRHVPSPYGGKVFATDLFGRHPSHLVDPFTGERTPLPDLPIPLSETEPMPCAPDEPRARSTVATDDGFAWDWSPHGVMVARGDTVFFCETGGGGDSWTPVHRSRGNSTMTINYRGGFFFVLEQRSLLTTVIDAKTLDRSAVIEPPPCREDLDAAYLVASTDDVLLLAHRAGDRECELFRQVYRARHRKGKARWARVTDIGDRAVFLDRVHGFTVGAGKRARRNCVYVVVDAKVEDPCRRRVVAHDVGVIHLRNPKHLAPLKSELSRCKVRRMWGEAHWIIPNDGSSSGDSIVALEQ